VAILAFRGTDSLKDWQKDFNAVLVDSKVGHIHKGFKQALDNIWEKIDTALAEHIREDRLLWVTGHSLGGALATLAVDRLTDSKIPIGGMYTFGGPMVGDEKFADNFDRKIKEHSFRFVNDEDIVTWISLPAFYHHIGIECFFDCAGVLHRKHVWYHKLLSYSDNAEVRSRPELDKLKAQYPNGIQDHSLDYYIKYLKKNLLAENPPEPEQRTFKDYANRLFRKGIS
jgi:triacylglycerol lipase